MNTSPFELFVDGHYWVKVFFVLSGFVLTIRWFKTRAHKSIYGATFRRYIRLMLPLLAINILYYFVAHMDVCRDYEFCLTIAKS